MRIYLARQVLPVSAPPVEDGAVAVEQGRVTAVGHRGELLRSAGADVEIRDLGDAVILPGLVNAHTHLDCWRPDLYSRFAYQEYISVRCILLWYGWKAIRFSK